MNVIKVIETSDVTPSKREKKQLDVQESVKVKKETEVKEKKKTKTTGDDKKGGIIKPSRLQGSG